MCIGGAERGRERKGDTYNRRRLCAEGRLGKLWASCTGAGRGDGSVVGAAVDERFDRERTWMQVLLHYMRFEEERLAEGLLCALLEPTSLLEELAYLCWILQGVGESCS